MPTSSPIEVQASLLFDDQGLAIDLKTVVGMKVTLMKYFQVNDILIKESQPVNPPPPAPVMFVLSLGI